MTLATTMLPSGPQHTRTHSQAQACIRSGQAIKRKRQEQEHEQERRVTYTQLEVQLHVGNVGSKTPGVDMKSTERSEHDYFPKKTKNATQDTQKCSQVPPKSIPGQHQGAKKHSSTAWGTKKLNFGGRVPHHGHQKCSKFAS